MIVDKYGRVAGSIDLATLAEMYAQTDDVELQAHYQQVAAESGVDLDKGSVAVAAGFPEPDDVPTTGVPEPEDEAPPKSGAGSGRDAWVAYAESLGVEVTDDMTRDEIIEWLEEE